MPPPVNPGWALTLQLPLPIHVKRYARNGLVPHALFESDVGSALNFVAGVCNKELFRYHGDVLNIPSGTGSARNRWRFAAHTSPLLRRLRATLLMARQNHGGAGSPQVTLYITNADGSVVYGSNTLNAGASAAGATDVPSEFIDGEIIIGGLPADSDVYGRFEDGTEARLISASVYEESLKLLPGNGYVIPQAVPVTAPIYDQRREDLYELATLLWKRGAAHLFNWAVDLESAPRTNATTTATNIIDNSSTTVSAATPGFTIDLTYCRTRALSTVPVKLWVLGSWVAGGGQSSGGALFLKDSGGATVGSITNQWTTTTPTWFSTTFNMPASRAKYDLQFSNHLGGTFSLYAVSLAQFAT